MFHSDFLVEAELAGAIKAAIDELPVKCREIFLLNRYENLKYHEIAEHLQLSQKTVEAQMSKALQHMRLRLAEYIVSMIPADAPFIQIQIGIFSVPVAINFSVTSVV
ncbi:MAG: sigma-70 family RNA polymerase sigma factor [Bacteroidales bacterium]|nr:sigma-70 family RNA polymerase sigma factor [Bacteroidales bacterium]